MTCTHCGRAELIPDHDRIHHIEVYACPVCGYRHYPAYPRRAPDKADEELAENQIGHIGPIGPIETKPKEKPMSRRKPFITRPCAGCGKEITGASNRLQWCDDCRRARQREWDKESKRKKAARKRGELAASPTEQAGATAASTEQAGRLSPEPHLAGDNSLTPPRHPALFLIFERNADLYDQIKAMAEREYRSIEDQAMYLLDRGTLFTPVPVTGLDSHPVVDRVSLARDLMPFIRKALTDGRL